MQTSRQDLKELIAEESIAQKSLNRRDSVSNCDDAKFCCLLLLALIFPSALSRPSLNFASHYSPNEFKSETLTINLTVEFLDGATSVPNSVHRFVSDKDLTSIWYFNFFFYSNDVSNKSC